MINRVLVPEILDGLDAADPRAQRSRRDLRMINTLMGNFRWVQRTVQSMPDLAVRGIVEIGAGDGQLAARLCQFGRVQAVDLVERPDDVDDRVEWIKGNVLEVLPQLECGIVVANLFVHHFEGQALSALLSAVAATGCGAFICNEPLRSRRGHWAGGILKPLVNDVTWHDMHVSIDAGFCENELPAHFSDEWSWEESPTLLGGLRSIGRRAL